LRGLLLGICGLLLLGGCAAKTHVMTPWISTENATALDVDWVIRYYDPRIVSVSNMTRLFGELKADGYSTALVIGKGLQEGDSYDGWLTNLSRAIEEMRSVTDMFFLWDDPQVRRGTALRNSLAAALTTQFPDVKFGVSINVTFPPPPSLQPIVPDLNYSYFSVILGYSYGAVYYDTFPNRTVKGKNVTYVPGGQGFYDSGETTKVRLAILKLHELAAQHGAEVWFTDNAHMKAGKLTTTTSQMLLDYVAGTFARPDGYGWFMFDIWGQYGDTLYTGEVSKGAPDSSSRYYFLTTVLIPLANSRLFENCNLSDRISDLEARVAQLEQISELPKLNRKDGTPAALIMIIGSTVALFSLTARRN